MRTVACDEVPRILAKLRVGGNVKAAAVVRRARPYGRDPRSRSIGGGSRDTQPVTFS